MIILNINNKIINIKIIGTQHRLQVMASIIFEYHQTNNIHVVTNGYQGTIVHRPGIIINNCIFKRNICNSGTTKKIKKIF